MRTYVRLGLLLAVVVALTMLAGRGTPAHAWSYPAVLNTNAASDSRADETPEVATDGGGNWVVVWMSSENLLDPNLGGTIGTDWDILVARSTDNGASWTAPAALNTNAATDSGSDRIPKLTTDGVGNWLAVWRSKENLNDPSLGYIGTDTDVFVSRSTDNGASWTAPAALNTNAATDSGHDQYPQVTTDGGGRWVVGWDSTEPNVGSDIGTDFDILVSRSTTQPTWPWTWTDPIALNTNAASDSGEDESPRVTTDGAGNWVTVWHSTEPNVGSGTGTDWDVLVARSTDNGATWTTPAALNTNAATDSGTDYAPQVTTDGGGNWVAVWQSSENLSGIGTDDDILMAHSTDNGGSWTAPTALNTNAGSDSGDDWQPQVGTDGGGNWVAVWWSEDSLGGAIETDRDILVARSTDNGATWTDPSALNTNAGSDSGNDTHARVMTDGGGNWVVVWHSTEPNVGSGIGTDEDILYSTEVWPTPPVGGVAELPEVSGSAGRNYIALAGLAAAALVALGAGGWYARRRWLG